MAAMGRIVDDRPAPYAMSTSSPMKQPMAQLLSLAQAKVCRIDLIQHLISCHHQAHFWLPLLRSLKRYGLRSRLSSDPKSRVTG